MTKYGLSGNLLKIIAAITMFIDHMGLMLFPTVTVFRIIGRISFPIYAFMIAEGCHHTRNKLRYFLSIFLLGAVCQTVFFIFDGRMYLGILITFSISILTVYALQYFKRALFSYEGNSKTAVIAFAVLIFTVTCVYFLNRAIVIDYGFFGCMTPVIVSVFRAPPLNKSPALSRLDTHYVRVFMLLVALLLVYIDLASLQLYSLLAIPLLLLYSGKRGRLKMKYFFYVFYPVHFILLQGILYIMYL